MIRVPGQPENPKRSRDARIFRLLNALFFCYVFVSLEIEGKKRGDEGLRDSKTQRDRVSVRERERESERERERERRNGR